MKTDLQLIIAINLPNTIGSVDIIMESNKMVGIIYSFCVYFVTNL